MLDSESSKRMMSLRFPLIVGVVFIHNYSNIVDLSGATVGLTESSLVVDFIRNMISQGFARLAVPTFFVLAGYLFFWDFEWSRKSFLIKLTARLRTLLLPFLIWNVLVLFLYFLIQILPHAKEFASSRSDRVLEFSLFDFVNAVFGINRTPIAYQFWFIRDLFLLVVLTPIFYKIVKDFPVIFLPIFYIIWLSDLWPIYTPSSEALLFYCFGAGLALNKKSLFEFDKYGVLALKIYIPLLIIDSINYGHSGNQYIHKIGQTVGLIGVLYLTKFILKKEVLIRHLSYLSGTSFFVYAIHEPLLTVMRKVLFVLINPKSPSIILMLYFLLPVVVIIIAIFLNGFTLRFMPKLYNVLTGRSVSKI